MKLSRKHESGQIFVLVLILLAVGPLLVVPMLRLGYSVQKFHQVVEINTLNAYAADSGVEYARYKIYNYPGEIRSDGLDEHIVINNIDVHVTAEFDYDTASYRITSTASRAQRSTTIECMVVIDVGLFGKVVACDGDLSINQCQFVSEEEGGADVFVNGNISISGSDIYPSLVDGDVTASGTVTVGEHSTVTGIITEWAQVIEFPPVDPQLHEDKAKLGGTWNGNMTLGTGTHYLGPLYIDGDLNIPGHTQFETNLYLEGTVYVTGTVTIDRTTLYGFGDILAEGDIHLPRCAFELDIVDFLPLLMSVNGDISIEGAASFRPSVQSIIYAPAPDSQITLSWVDAFGSVAARSVLLDHSTLDYPAELRGRADLPGAGLDTVTYTFK